MSDGPRPTTPPPTTPTPPAPPPGALAPLPDVVAVTGDRSLNGSLRTPGDKSISHRALILSALAEGESTVTGLSDGEDVAHTLAAIVALGATARWSGTDSLATRSPTTDPPTTDPPTTEPPASEPVLHISGGRERLQPPADRIDCGNSGTGMRLLAGMVAGLGFEAELFGDESLSARPMDRIAEPLRDMGATLEGRGERVLPPLVIKGRGHQHPLSGIDWTIAMASAQVKSALLLAALAADGEMVVREQVATRANTEEMLADAGADISVESWGRGRVVRLRASRLRPGARAVPGDPSQAAFWVVAGCLAADSSVVVEHVYAGAERVGFVGVLQRMGADVALRPSSARTADLVARSSALVGTVIEAAEIPSVDEVPILAVAAAAAEGTTVFRDVGELRVKEVDRLTATAALVRLVGARAEVEGDDLRIHGLGDARKFSHGRFATGGDHRMGMAAAVVALVAGEGESTIEGFGAVRTSYPGFLRDLERLAGAASPPAARAVNVSTTAARAVIAGPAVSASEASADVLLAIDGPAGSGKSTVSRAVAGRLGVERLDTGAMYRAVAWAVLDRGVDVTEAAAVAALAREAELELGGERVRIDGTDVTEAIRSPEVSRAVSVVAANPEVRAVLVQRQRAWAAAHGGRGVVEGRDIGTVVFPEAALKVYLTASAQERARRRHDEPPGGVARRDHLDSTRTASPLYKADDARLLDTTGRSVEDVVEEVLSWL